MSTQNTDTVVHVKNLRRTFVISRTTKVHALNGVDVTLQRGSCLAVVGESGSGKSTLARIIVGLESADEGTVELLGQPVKPTTARRELSRRARVVQMVFQDPAGSLNRRLPVGAAIAEVLKAHFTLTKPERDARVIELFEEVGLDPKLTTSLPGELSGGQKQRVAIARALAAEPDLVVLDEAVSALDVSVQAQVLDLLERLRVEKNLTYLFITHDLSVVRQVADTVIVMRNGLIVERGTVSEILDTPQEPYTQLLLECAPEPGWRPDRAAIDRLTQQLA